MEGPWTVRSHPDSSVPDNSRFPRQAERLSVLADRSMVFFRRNDRSVWRECFGPSGQSIARIFRRDLHWHRRPVFHPGTDSRRSWRFRKDRFALTGAEGQAPEFRASISHPYDAEGSRGFYRRVQRTEAGGRRRSLPRTTGIARPQHRESRWSFHARRSRVMRDRLSFSTGQSILFGRAEGDLLRAAVW